MQNICIDVVIPCAGTGDFFEEALNSVLHQTFLPTCIYVVDNCSGSNMYRQVVSKKQAKNIIYIELPKRLGMTENWQYCLTLGDSKYYAFLHDDDFWEKTYLEDAIRLLEKDTNCSIVLTAHYFFQTDVGIWGIKPNELLEKSDKFNFYNSLTNSLRNYVLSTSNACHMSALIFKRTAISFPIFPRFIPDQWFLSTYLCMSNILLVPKVNSFIRLSSLNLTSSMSQKGFISVEIVQHLRNVTDFYIRNNKITSANLVSKLDISYSKYIRRLKQACFSWPLSPVLLKFGAELIENEALFIRDKKISTFTIKYKSLLWIILSLCADIKYFWKDIRSGN